MLCALAGTAFAAEGPQQPAARAASPAGSDSPVLAPAAPAQPVAGWTLAQLRDSFDRADTNGDGVLTRAEAQQLIYLPRSFEELDANKDGVLSRAEYESLLQ